MPAAIATRSRNARPRGSSLPTIAVMRMCSPRWNAMIDPSIASQRNRIDASSSDQTSGCVKDVSARHPHEQYDDLGQHQQCGWDFDQRAKSLVQFLKPSNRLTPYRVQGAGAASLGISIVFLSYEGWHRGSAAARLT